MPMTRHHAEWLSLLDISGPFLSMDVLERAWPQGLDAHDAELTAQLRLAYDEWLDNQQGVRPDPAMQRAWVEWIVRNVLEFPAETIWGAQTGQAAGQSPVPVSLCIGVLEHGETLKPDLVIHDPASPSPSPGDPQGEVATGAEGRGEGTTPRLLIQIVPHAQKLESPLAGHEWKASPAARMMELLHATGVRLGILSNGEQWMLVDAPKDQTTGYISWYASLWLEEPITLRAWQTLLRSRRFFGVPASETIEALLADSANDQQAVTDQLGYQVRSAVELLVQAIDQADQDRRGALLSGLAEETLYEAAVTVMMRLVFLFCAEERGLILPDDPIYNENYAVSTLRGQLHKAQAQLGEDVLERREDAWLRLLATFRAVHGGIRHDRLTLPAYGGSLFDPDRFPFLEGRAHPSPSIGRAAGETPQGKGLHSPAPEVARVGGEGLQPIRINNHVVLHILDALQMLQVRQAGSGPAEARRLSFRALDIEQIGHVYEGLLDHTAVRATMPVLGLAGTRNKEPEIALPTLEERRGRGEDALIEFLVEQTGRSANALRRALATPPDLQSSAALRHACRQDESLYQRLLPFAGVIRPDAYAHPMVILPGSAYVTAGKTRRATGTHYTPRSLTEPIVQHTLEPQVYRGPAEGWPKEKWQLRSPAELLSLKVCDMAMGSAAFLVQACRYLSERLLEAWERSEHERERKGAKDTKGVLITAEGERIDDPNKAIPANPDDRLALARRLITDRCLYGVDKNPLAVEMAKLSLWLITLDKGRPFTFLDHALKCGDSLVGVSLDQLSHWSLDTSGTPALFAEGIRLDIQKLITLRRQIAATPTLDARDQAAKAYLHAQAEAIAHDLRQGANLLIASYYNDLPTRQQIALRNDLLHVFREGKDAPANTPNLGDLRPFHWQIEFPEVFLTDARSGFDAFVGNPPFLGGTRISTHLGGAYLHHLQVVYPTFGSRADLCSLFFLRAFALLSANGVFGLLATNTIAQSDTREAGLDEIRRAGGDIYRARSSMDWPGAAGVSVSIVHVSKAAASTAARVLDNRIVEVISPHLDETNLDSKPYPLQQNRGKSFEGSKLDGLGFILDTIEAQQLLVRDPRNAEVVLPYLTGEDLNTRPDQSPSRWAICFFDWDIDKAASYPDCFAILQERVCEARQHHSEARTRDHWWQFQRARAELYRTIAIRSAVLVCSQISKHLSFVYVPNGWIYSCRLIVIAFPEEREYAVLQSSVHEVWARKHCATLETRLSYTPSDGFETFPFPTGISAFASIADAYHEHRRQVMLARQEGLTKTYNRFHNPDETAADIARLRDLHVQMDQTVAAAYGWHDLDLGHGFHQTAQGLRFTISEAARREVLSRLLALNHERYEEEVKAGLHEKKGGKGKKKAEAEGQMRLV